MEARCEAARSYVLLWEERGACPEVEEGFGEFEAHLSACPDCARSFSGLLPLIRRDAASRPVEAADGAFVARVMDGLPQVSDSKGRRPARFLVPALAAAALALVVLGGVLVPRAPAGGGKVAEMTVRFVLDAPEASSVVLVGDFSDWASDDRYRLTRTASGEWELSVKLRKHQTYAYGFLVDGEQWIADPRATEAIDDGFGSVNSLLRL